MPAAIHSVGYTRYTIGTFVNFLRICIYLFIRFFVVVGKLLDRSPFLFVRLCFTFLFTFVHLFSNYLFIFLFWRPIQRTRFTPYLIFNYETVQSCTYVNNTNRRVPSKRRTQSISKIFVQHNVFVCDKM